MSGTGLGYLALGELNRSEKANGRSVASALDHQDKIIEGHMQFVFRAKSQVHGFRAGLYAHRATEDELIAALKEENANHPLASREAVDAAVKDKHAKALVNPEIIKKTYPDGKLPEGAIIPPNAVQVAIP